MDKFPPEFVDGDPHTQADIGRKRTMIYQQAKVAMHIHDKMPCPCGKTIPITHMYQCYKCGVFLCGECASRHFDIVKPLMAVPVRESEADGES